MANTLAYCARDHVFSFARLTSPTKNYFQLKRKNGKIENCWRQNFLIPSSDICSKWTTSTVLKHFLKFLVNFQFFFYSKIYGLQLEFNVKWGIRHYDTQKNAVSWMTLSKMTSIITIFTRNYIQQEWHSARMTFSKNDIQQEWHSARMTFSKNDIQQEWQSARMTFSKNDIQQEWHSTRMTFSKFFFSRKIYGLQLEFNVKWGIRHYDTQKNAVSWITLSKMTAS